MDLNHTKDLDFARGAPVHSDLSLAVAGEGVLDGSSFFVSHCVSSLRTTCTCRMANIQRRQHATHSDPSPLRSSRCMSAQTMVSPFCTSKSQEVSSLAVSYRLHGSAVPQGPEISDRHRSGRLNSTVALKFAGRECCDVVACCTIAHCHDSGHVPRCALLHSLLTNSRRAAWVHALSASSRWP